MSANAEARQGSLDQVLNGLDPSYDLAGELFDIVDTLGRTPSLRRALSDQSAPDQARQGLVTSLFQGKVSDGALKILAEATNLRWNTSGAFVNALERQGVRAALATAQAEGQLDETEDQLFRVGRIVDGNPDLRAALSDRSTPASARQGLLADVLGDKVIKPVAGLARRAVLARDRTFDLTMNGYLKAAADMRGRAVATVEVARPLADDQAERLRAALVKQAGRDVTLRVVVNPEVLGGVRVSLGDEVIEGTVAGRLNDARRKLS
ncbi:F0F1 ATP synthase subunit delta [Nigerium sp.]|uniref:F0F1 ATP synthase subunit delta n=1 Tax=Nigerium sp. TaxID=2042655 RepID=UPI003221ADBE